MEEIFEQILLDFDYSRVQDVMYHLNWRWSVDGTMQVPSIAEMRKMCNYLFKHALETYNISKDMVSESCGGFEVTIYKNENIELKFVLETLDSLSCEISSGDLESLDS